MNFPFNFNATSFSRTRGLSDSAHAQKDVLYIKVVYVVLAYTWIYFIAGA